MRLLTYCLIALSADAATTAQEIMARVAENQDRAEQLRARYVYRQTTAVRVRNTHNELTREEITNYEVAPTPEGISRKEADFACKYREKKALLKCEKSGEPAGEGSGKEVDAMLARSMRDDLTGSTGGKDGLSPKLFPLTSKEQAHYNFLLAGEATVQGMPVYQITFKSKQGDGDNLPWAGEAIVSRDDFEPVQVATKLAHGVPFLVRTALGTNIRGLGFTVTYSRFDDKVWFPVSYGAEFDFRVLFVFSRKVSVSLSNSEFKKTSADSSVSFR